MIQFDEHIFQMGWNRNHQLLKIFNHTKMRLFFQFSWEDQDNFWEYIIRFGKFWQFRNAFRNRWGSKDYGADFSESRTFSSNSLKIISWTPLGWVACAATIRDHFFLHVWMCASQVTWRTWRTVRWEAVWARLVTCASNDAAGMKSIQTDRQEKGRFERCFGLAIRKDTHTHDI